MAFDIRITDVEVEMITRLDDGVLSNEATVKLVAADGRRLQDDPLVPVLTAGQQTALRNIIQSVIGQARARRPGL